MADLMIGASIVLALSTATVAAGVITDVQQSSDEAARAAAVEIARNGDEGDALRRAARRVPDASISWQRTGEAVQVTIDAEVAAPHPILLIVTAATSTEARVPLAPYGSRP